MQALWCSMRGRTRRAGPLPLLLALLLAGLLASSLAFSGCAPSAQGQAAEVSREEAAEPVVEAPKPIIDPLNGEVVASAELITRRPLAVKVENDPAARPQSGLVDAEMVVEELVEGGVTRFICFFLANESSALGPNRSVRPSDIDITYYLKPLLICSGGAPQVMAMVRQSGLMYLEEDGTHFWRDRKRSAPHNLYTNTERLRAYLAEQGDTYNQAVAGGLTFYSPEELAAMQAALAQGEPPEIPVGVIPVKAGSINVAYGSGCAASYQYDPASNKYLRFVQSKPHTDLTTGAQLAPRNVIVEYVQLSSSGVRDVVGTETPNSEVVGKGQCLIFSGGKVVAGTWSKASRNDPTRYFDAIGREIELYPGQTWIHLIPDSIKVAFGA
jgi:hypothetical protein